MDKLILVHYHIIDEQIYSDPLWVSISNLHVCVKQKSGTFIEIRSLFQHRRLSKPSGWALPFVVELNVEISRTNHIQISRYTRTRHTDSIGGFGCRE